MLQSKSHRSDLLHKGPLINSWHAVLRLKSSISALRILPIGPAFGSESCLDLDSYTAQCDYPGNKRKLLGLTLVLSLSGCAMFQQLPKAELQTYREALLETRNVGD